MHVANGYFNEKSSTVAAMQADLEEKVFQARKIMREGKTAVEHYIKTGLIRPKTQAEIDADLAKAKQEAKAIIGRPGAELAPIIEAQTREALELFEAKEAKATELAQDLGISANAN